MVTLTGLEDRIQELEKQATLLPTKDDANLYSQTLMGQWNVLDDFSVDQADLIGDLVTLYTAISSKINSHITVFDAHTADLNAHHPTTGHVATTVDQLIFEAHTGDLHAHHTAVLITGFSPPEALPLHTGSHDDHPIAHWYAVFNTGIAPIDSAVTPLTPVNILHHYPPASWDQNGTKIIFAESGIYTCTYTMVVEKTGDIGHVRYNLELGTGLNPGDNSTLKWSKVRNEVLALGSRASCSTTLILDMRSGQYIELKSAATERYAGHALPNGITMSIQKVGHNLGQIEE